MNDPLNKLDRWLDRYGESHQNRANQYIHQAAVPLIYLAVIALMVCLPVPSNWQYKPGINWALLILMPAILFYLSISPRYALLMAFVSLSASALFEWLLRAKLVPIAEIALVVFVVAWLAQFIGHWIEGKRPSFLTDIQFLLIGPIWVIEEWRDRFWSRH